MQPRMSPSFKPRRLKISRSGYALRRFTGPRPAVPYIRLRGYWLADAGFAAGERIDVFVAERSITIVPAGSCS